MGQTHMIGALKHTLSQQLVCWIRFCFVSSSFLSYISGFNFWPILRYCFSFFFIYLYITWLFYLFVHQHFWMLLYARQSSYVFIHITFLRVFFYLNFWYLSRKMMMSVEEVVNKYWNYGRKTTSGEVIKWCQLIDGKRVPQYMIIPVCCWNVLIL